MKKLLLSAALAAVLASPAFAQSYENGGNLLNDPGLVTESGANDAAPAPAMRAYAAAPLPRAHRRASASTDPDTVYYEGKYLGRDPDPNVRLELERDPTPAS